MQLHLKVRIAKNDNSYTNRIVEPTMTPSNISGVIRNAGEIPSGRKTFQLSAYVDKPISDLSGQHLFSEDNYNGWVAKGIVNPEHTSVLNVYRLNADGTVSDTYSSESWKITVNFLDGFIPEETDILFIAFDEQSEAHPTSASISTGYEFRSREITSALWFIAFSDLGIVGKKVDKIDITFYDWVGGGTPRISYVGMQPTVTFDGSYVQSFSGSETAFEPETEFTPGILEQYADIRLLDHNGYLKVLAEGGALYSNQKIDRKSVV